MPQSTERVSQLEAFKRLLNTPDGELLVEELSLTWDQFTLIGETEQMTAYNVGLRDAFKFIQMIQTGALIHE